MVYSSRKLLWKGFSSIPGREIRYVRKKKRWLTHQPTIRLGFQNGVSPYHHRRHRDQSGSLGYQAKCFNFSCRSPWQAPKAEAKAQGAEESCTTFLHVNSYDSFDFNSFTIRCFTYFEHLWTKSLIILFYPLSKIRFGVLMCGWRWYLWYCWTFLIFPGCEAPCFFCLEVTLLIQPRHPIGFQLSDPPQVLQELLARERAIQVNHTKAWTVHRKVGTNWFDIWL